MKWRVVLAGSGVLLAVAVVVFAASRKQAAPAVSDPTPGMISTSRPAPHARSQYSLKVTFDPSAAQVSATQAVRFTNGGEAALNELYLHLFANSRFLQRPRGQGASASITIDSVTANGQRVRHAIVDRELLRVPLPRPLAPGDTVELALQWREQVPQSGGGRFGTSASTAYLGNFYPILAVNDQGGWHLDRYVPTGDPFFSEVADYDVTFDVPAGFVVAATGQPDPARTAAGRATYRFVATNVRDFAAAVSPTWKIYEATVDGIQVRYYRDTTPSPETNLLTPSQALDTITGSVHFFNEKWGKYPYRDLAVVDRGSMEYPQFVLASARPEAIAHELAHQWWYGVVGNDQLRQIWDEGLAEFSTLYYLAGVGHPKAHPFSSARSEAMDKTLYTYWSQAQAQSGDYYASIYGRGWMLWEALRRTMGTPAFERMVREFYASHQFAIATWDDWRQAVRAAGGQPAVQVFDAFVKGDAVPANAPADIRLQP